MNLEPVWLKKARGERGVREIPGAGSNPEVEKYHAATRGGASKDDVPWCSSALCWVFETLGMTSPRSKSSQSWVRWGTRCGLIVGAVVVFRWRPWSHRGHVALLVGLTDQGDPVVWGGNQADGWSLRSYPRRKIRACRWPSPPTINDPGTARTR